MGRKNYKRINYPGYEKKHKFPCITDEDGTHFFLPSSKYYLVVRGKRYTYSTPSVYFWREVKCGDTILKYDICGHLISAFEVCEVNYDYLIAIHKPIYTDN